MEDRYWDLDGYDAVPSAGPVDPVLIDSAAVGGALVSTAFVSTDPTASEPPLLFVTEVVGGPLDGRSWRYASWAEAIAGHAAAVRSVEQG